MARKATQKSRKTQNRVTWDFSQDVVPLLAWLDYCIQHGMDFDSTVVNHLRTYANKEVQFTQAEGKLRTLWGSWGHCKKFNDFKYRQGSSDLLGLNPIEHEAIGKFREGLAPPAASPDAGYPLEEITPGHQTRSQTLSEQRQDSDDSSLSDLSSIPDPDDWLDAAAKDTTVGFSEQSARSKKRRIEASFSDSAPLPAGETPKTRSKDEPRPENVPNRPVVRSIVSRGTQTTPMRDGLADDITQPRLDYGVFIGERRIKQMQSEALTLAGRLHEARWERDKLLHCARAAEGAEDKTGMLVSLQRENVVLKKQLQDLQEARENAAALGKIGRLGPSDHEIGAELGVIESSIADACASLHWDGWLLDRPKEEPRAADLMLLQWTRKLSGSSSSSFMAACGDASGVKMVDALRSLVAAALWALVWQQPLDEIVNAESPILDYYKKQLLARDGPAALRQIELLAYESLTSASHFDVHLVDARSRTLAEYIHHVLKPLFREDPEPQGIGGSEAAVLSADTTPPSLLEDAVQRALQLAAKLYLTDRWCLWQFAQPGGRLDARTMTVAGQAAAARERLDEPKVQLCLFPALLMSKTPKGPRAYEKMGGPDIRGPEDLGDYKVVAKGLVLVE